MEGIGGLERFLGMIDVKPGRDLQLMLSSPVSISLAGLDGLLVQYHMAFRAQPFPFKQPASDDLRDISIRREDHRLAHSIQDFLEAAEVRLIL